MPLLVVLPHGSAEVPTHRWNAFRSVYRAAQAIEAPADNKGEFPLIALFRADQPALVLTCKYQSELSYELGFDDVKLRDALARLVTSPMLNSGVA